MKKCIYERRLASWGPDLPILWEDANFCEGRRILLTMPDSVYINSAEEKSIVAIQPRQPSGLASRGLRFVTVYRTRNANKQWYDSPAYNIINTL
jgi:hypothetical protein